MRILGIDPGLQTTGFGVIDAEGQQLQYVASGTIRTTAQAMGDLPARLKVLFDGICEITARYAPQASAVEIVFVNVNPQSTLLLGQARGACLTALVSRDLPVAEYTALQMKKAIVGHGRADKSQVRRWSSACWACPACPARTPPTRWAWPSPTRTWARRWRGWPRPRPSPARPAACTAAAASASQRPPSTASAPRRAFALLRMVAAHPGLTLHQRIGGRH
jgi:crossover junction endodeoxyribonuclease RuvC